MSQGCHKGEGCCHSTKLGLMIYFLEQRQGCDIQYLVDLGAASGS